MRSLVLCLIFLPSAVMADTIIQDGDYEAELMVLEDGLLMTGGQVDHMVLWADGPYQIEGGAVGRAELESGNLNVAGGTVESLVRSESRGGGQRTTISFQGYNFRVWDAGRTAYNFYRVEGWLADGSFISTEIINSMEERTSRLPLVFEIVPSLPPPGDRNQSWTVDLEDLNDVRNNFGETTTLEDLNDVRNNFGVGQFSLDLSDPNVREITMTTTVPEPGTLLLSFLLFPILKGFLQWHTN